MSVQLSLFFWFLFTYVTLISAALLSRVGTQNLSSFGIVSFGAIHSVYYLNYLLSVLAVSDFWMSGSLESLTFKFIADESFIEQRRHST